MPFGFVVRLMIFAEPAGVEFSYSPEDISGVDNDMYGK